MAQGERWDDLDAARLHLRLAEDRVRRRARRTEALRGLAAGALAAGLLVGVVRIAPWVSPEGLGFGGASPAAVARGGLAIAAGGLALAGGLVGAWRGGRAGRRAGALWERAAPPRDETEIGLAAAAAALLDRERHGGSPFERALLVRFLALPLPSGSGLVRALPAPAPARIAAALGIAALALCLPLRGAGGVPPGPGGSGARPVETPHSTAAGLPPGRLAERIEELRRELEVREGAARLLDGAEALAPLATALRTGGALDLPESDRERLAPGDRASLELAAREIRARALEGGAAVGDPALGENARRWAERLERIAAAGSTDEPDGEPPRLIDASAELAAIAGEWSEGSGARGPVAAAAPEGVPGGSATGAEPTPLDDLLGSEPAAPGAAGPLELPPGVPVAPGESRPGASVSPPAARAIDPGEGWLRRSELEPHWFPVIRAYERAGDRPAQPEGEER